MVCATHFSRSNIFVDNSPVQPSRASRYTLDSRPSLDIHHNDRPLLHTPSFTYPETPTQQPSHALRRKKAYSELQQVAPQPAQPNTTGHRRNSSLDKWLKKIQGVVKHKSNTASFASVVIKADDGEIQKSDRPATLRRKGDMLNLRFDFEQDISAGSQVQTSGHRVMSVDGESILVADQHSVEPVLIEHEDSMWMASEHGAERAMSEDGESEWVTDDESDADGHDFQR